MACITAIVVVASTGFRNVPLSVATYAVAAAVSILPASLIAVVSLTLARASTDLASRNALVRRMDAIEALAGVENVCSDKTGTLTVGRMVVRKLWIPAMDWRENEAAAVNTERGQAYSLETGSDPFYPRGEVKADLVELRNEASPELDLKRRTKQLSQDEVDEHDTVVHPEGLESNLRELALCAALCNQATLSRPSSDDSQWEAHGDPTEIALQVAAHKLGHGKPFLTHAKHALSRVASAHSHQRPPVAGIKGHYEPLVEHPFDSTVKRMSIAYRFVPDDRSEEPHILCLLKGAVERVFEKCTRIQDKQLSEGHKENTIRKMDALAAQGLRVLALCGKKLPNSEAERVTTMSRDEFENDFAFLGLAGIYDPPRKESAGAVADCLRAGITPRMLTGDHPATATAIALSIGILDKAYAKSAVMTGQQFDALSDEQIDAMEELPLVVARCAPETKASILVQALSQPVGRADPAGPHGRCDPP
jgi:Na+-exporting ATPase